MYTRACVRPRQSPRGLRCFSWRTLGTLAGLFAGCSSRRRLYAGCLHAHRSCGWLPAWFPSKVVPVALFAGLQECVWWVDLYEVTSPAGYTSEVRAEIAFGPHSLKTLPLQCNTLGTYLIDDETGRLKEQRIYMPSESTSVHVTFASKGRCSSSIQEDASTPWKRRIDAERHAHREK